MSTAMKRLVSVVLALVIMLAAVTEIMPVRASAASSSQIKYSVKYVGDKVQLTLTAKNSTNTIYYTTNGKKPTTSSAKYTGALQATGKATIRAIEVTKKGKTAASISITVQPRVQALQVTVKESSTGLKLLKVTTATAGASIYYTIDGTDPTKKSYEYKTGSEPIYTEGTVFRFRAYKNGMKSSKIVSYGELASFNEISADKIDSELAEVVRLVNKERTSRGLEALKIDADMMKAADIRAKELYVKYDHTRPDGSSCFTVFDEVGLSHPKPGENIGKTSEDTPAHIVELWMNSPKHRENILSVSFTRIGVGHYVKGGLGHWVQLFLR